MDATRARRTRDRARQGWYAALSPVALRPIPWLWGRAGSLEIAAPKRRTMNALSCVMVRIRPRSFRPRRPHPFCQCGCDLVEDGFPAADLRLAEEAGSGVPGAVRSVEHPSPVGPYRERNPDRNTQRPAR